MSDQGYQALLVWSLSDLKGYVSIIHRSPEFFSFLVQSETSNEIWRYRLPDLFLKERTPWGQKTLPAIPAAISSSEKLLLVPEDLTAFAFYSNESDEFHKLKKGTFRRVQAFDNWLVVDSESADSNHLSVYTHEDAREVRLLLEIAYPQDEQLVCHCD